MTATPVFGLDTLRVRLVGMKGSRSRDRLRKPLCMTAGDNRGFARPPPVLRSGIMEKHEKAAWMLRAQLETEEEESSQDSHLDARHA
jgi:hypothetical protein